MGKTGIVCMLLTVCMVLPAIGADNIYVVKPGDTLSGIALKIYGKADRWPDLLKANPQITDPSKIYPGDSIETGQGESYTVSSGTEAEPFTEYQPLPVTGAEETASAEIVPPPDIPVQIYKKPPVVSVSRYRSSGYISKELPPGSIIGAVASKNSLVEGDEIVIDQPAAEGSAFTVMRPMQKVYHPVSGEYLGWVIRVIGWADVTCQGSSSSRARLVATVDAVNVGDRVVPFDPDDILENNIIDKSPSQLCLAKSLAGYIVATQEAKATLVEGDVVFIDRGRANGTKAGDQFSVYEDIDPEWPIEYGVLQVLRVGEETSTALVVRSDREIGVSDLIQPRFSGSDASGS